MGAALIEALGNNPLRVQQSIDQHNAAQASLPGIAADVALRQTQAQQAQNSLRDQGIIQQALRTWDGQDVHGLFMQAVRNGISGQGGIDLQNSLVNMQQNALKLDSDKLASLDRHHDQALGILEPILSMPPERQADAYAAGLKQVQKSGFLTPDEIGQLPQQWDNPAAMGQRFDQLKLHSAVVKEALDTQQTKKAASEAAASDQDVEDKKRQQAVADASRVNDQPSYLNWVQKNHLLFPDAPGAYSPQYMQNVVRSGVAPDKLPEYDANQAFLQNSHWTDRHAAVDAIASDPQVRKTFYGRVDNATDKASYEKALADASEAQKAVDFATNPAVNKNKLNEAAAVAGATARATEQARQSQYAGTPLEHVVPGMQNAAASHFQKVTDARDQSIAAADDLDDMVSLAKQGDPLSYSYLPTTGVLTINSSHGVKRVNGAEIASMSGAGGFADQLKGWIGKKVDGSSLDPRILQSFSNMSGSIRRNAETLYGHQVEAGNKTYNSAYQATPSKPLANQQPAVNAPNTARTSSNQRVVTAPDGSVHTFPDQASADRFKKLAGIQ